MTNSFAEEFVNEWSVSKKEIYIADGIYVRGELNYDGDDDFKISPVFFSVNNIVYRKSEFDSIRWNTEDAGKVIINIDILYDFNNNSLFFDEPGFYHVKILSSVNEEEIYAFEVNVIDIPEKWRKGLKIFSEKETLNAIYSGVPDQKGLENLKKLESLYADSPWAKYAKVSLGIYLFNNEKKRMISSKKDVISRRKNMSEISEYFILASEMNLGRFTDYSLYYLGYCFALKESYIKSENSLLEASKSGIVQLSIDSYKLLEEVRIVNSNENK